MLKKTFILLILLIISIQFSFNVNAQNSLPLKSNDLWGNWNLMYENDYGYDFKFYKDNKAVVILYLNTNSIIFRGTYSIENESTLKIDISEMKNEEKTKNLNLKKGFVKLEASYFIFNCRITTESNKKIFELRPLKIFIDGNDSEGYFEPFFKLSYSGQ
jgi:hypothetical protein